MTRLIIRLLRLLLQVVIFLLTEKWVELGGKEQPSPEPPKKPPALKREPTRRKVFDPSAGRPAAERRRGRAPEPLLHGDLGLEHPREEGGIARRVLRAQRERDVPPALPTRAPSRSFSSTVRDPRAIRQAMIVSAAFGPPASRRLLRGPR